MRIAGFQKLSTVDYPGKLAAVVFTAGCNLDCSYCHNRALIDPSTRLPWWDAREVLGILAKRRGFLDGVAISGGEPTLQPDLEDFAGQVRDLGYAVKLDTNGTQPAVLSRLIARGLLDYVAMDVKAPLEKYETICGAGVEIAAIESSIALLLEGQVDYEFRTTVSPLLSHEDLKAISRLVRGARRHVLQRCRPVQDGRFAETPSHEAASYSVQTLLEWAEGMRENAQVLLTRGMGMPEASGRDSHTVLYPGA